ncbi:HU family DNA-binding protein [Vibrio crassostreae]|uniref:HU family DNA-binding protein n=1 Tax=Vibrio crassostreae TaxID=246167 RepID=UPI001B3036CF|nr:HU family DNA-binding protein [Vibrio crassostreae]
MERCGKTYTKNDMVEELYTLNEGIITRTVAKKSVDNLFKLLNDELTDFNSVTLRHVDTLVPRKRSGGRPVRNPKTGETKLMHDDVTVKLKGKSVTPMEINEKVTHTILQDKLSDMSYSPKVAEDTLSIFLGLLKEISQGAGRMEVRNFGIFYSKWNDERNSRNPATGEKVIAKAGWSLGYKCSKKLKKVLTQKYI